MRNSRNWLFPLALVAVLAACDKPADGATPAGAADEASASAGSDAAIVAEAPATGDAASSFVLDMDKADAWFDTLGRIARDPSVAAASEDGEDSDPIAMDASESVDAYIARIEADPEARRLATLGGMSVSDFARTHSAMTEGMLAAGMMEATGTTTVPEGINPQYVEFARTHKAELEAKVAAIQAQSGGE